MKKTGSKILNIVTWFFVVLAVCVMIFTLFSVLTLDQTQRNLFGYRAYIVLSDSMKATDFGAGDLVVSKIVDCDELEAGDIISFISRNDGSNGEVFTHKIRERTVNNYGEPSFVTYGTSTNENDEALVSYSDVLGQYKFRLPGAGTFFSFLKTVPGYIICILLPFLILIAIQIGQSIRLFKKYQSEQKAEIQAERDRLAKEYEETKATLDELKLMKQQLEQQTGGILPPVVTAGQPQQAEQPGQISVDKQGEGNHNESK